MKEAASGARLPIPSTLSITTNSDSLVEFFIHPCKFLKYSISFSFNKIKFLLSPKIHDYSLTITPDSPALEVHAKAASRWLAQRSLSNRPRRAYLLKPPECEVCGFWEVTKPTWQNKTLIHNKKKAIFHCKTEGYNPNQDALHQLARHQQTIIFRLRTGHCRLNSHLKRIGVKTSAQCPCGEADQTPEHYLQSCSLHQQARQQIWPTCVSLKTKLWGSAEDLLLTSRYAALTGERI